MSWNRRTHTHQGKFEAHPAEYQLVDNMVHMDNCRDTYLGMKKDSKVACQQWFPDCFHLPSETAG